MKRLSSITTTVRSPERVKGFLETAKKLEGKAWNKETQEEFQIRLIGERKYGFNKSSFYKRIPSDLANLHKDSSQSISFEQAKEMFEKAKFVEPPMRGRQSMNSLTKLGLAFVGNGTISITESGISLLQKGADEEAIIFRSLPRMQIPNPINKKYPANGEYDIKPLVGTLHLIHKVNQAEESAGREPCGLSRVEFRLFVPTLLHHKNIDTYAKKIIERRKLMRESRLVEGNRTFNEYDENFAIEFLGTNKADELKKFAKNLKDYGDNLFRYFRIAGYVVRNGAYINFAPAKMNAILSLLAVDSGKSIPFESKKDYIAYLSAV